MNFKVLLIFTLIIGILNSSFANNVDNQRHIIYATKYCDEKTSEEWALLVDTITVKYPTSSNQRVVANVKKCPIILNEYGEIDQRYCQQLTDKNYYDFRFIESLYKQYKGKEHIGIVLEIIITFGLYSIGKTIVKSIVTRALPGFLESSLFRQIANFRKLNPSKTINDAIRVYQKQINDYISANFGNVIIRSLSTHSLNATSWLGRKLVTAITFLTSLLIYIEVWRIIDPFNTFKNNYEARESDFLLAKNLIASNFNYSYSDENVDELGARVIQSINIAKNRIFNQPVVYQTCNIIDSNNLVLDIGSSLCFVDPIKLPSEATSMVELMMLTGNDPR